MCHRRVVGQVIQPPGTLPSPRAQPCPTAPSDHPEVKLLLVIREQLEHGDGSSGVIGVPMPGQATRCRAGSLTVQGGSEGENATL